MVKKFKSLCFSRDKWQLTEKGIDNFQKTIATELSIKLNRQN